MNRRTRLQRRGLVMLVVVGCLGFESECGRHLGVPYESTMACLGGSAVVDVLGVEATGGACGTVQNVQPDPVSGTHVSTFEARATPTRTVATCSHAIPGAAPGEPARCSGEVEIERTFSPTSNFTEIRVLRFGVAGIVTGGSATFDAEIDCLTNRGQHIQAILVFDGTNEFELNPVADSARCVVTLTIDSEAADPGATFHSLVLWEPRARQAGPGCIADDQCDNTRCGPTGLCQQGLDGDPCASSRDCAGLCGPLGTCQSGTEGDPCTGHWDCTPGYACGPGATPDLGQCGVPF